VCLSPVVHTSNISSCQKSQFFCGCEQLLLLQKFVITENIKKRPVFIQVRVLVSEDTDFNVPQDLFHFKAVIFSEV
jgi:hypothetical protein